MLFDDLKFVIYVCRSKRGRWSAAPVFIKAARKLALQESLTGAILDDGKAFLHIVEGPERSVDRFMAFVARDRHLTDLRVLHETRRATRVFAGTPIGYCFDDTWRWRLSALTAGGPVYRSDVREFCLVLLARMGVAPDPDSDAGSDSETDPELSLDD